MSINKKGFLSEEVLTWSNVTKQKYVDTFKICNYINEFAQKLLFELNIHNRLIDELIIGAAYKRLISSYQGSIILAERGMSNEMKVVSRNLLEHTFLIFAISKNKDFARKFLLNDEIQRKKMLNKYSSLSPDIKKDTIHPDVVKVLEEIKTNIIDKDIKEIKTWQIAKEAELDDHYNTYYSLLSLVVHPTARDFQSDYEFNASNEITTIKFGPNDSDIEKVLLSNAGYILMAVNQIKYLFKISIEDEISKISNEFNTIWKSKLANN